MRRTDKVAGKVQALLPGELGCVGSVVFNPAYAYVLNGVIVDGTAYKNTVIAKWLKLVFFERDRLKLTYSQPVYNLTGPSTTTFFTGTVDEMASQIATTLISSGAVVDMLKPYTLRDFLQQYWPDGILSPDVGHLFEACCAAFLAGDTEIARSGFNTLTAQVDAYLAEHGKARTAYSEERFREVYDVAALLSGSDEVLRQHIVDNATRNASLLGFQAIGAGPGLRSS